jgi:hypothetical protein
MFRYSDPGKTLKPATALANYRMLLHGQYRQHGKLARSAFTLLEAFQEVAPAKTQVAAVEWSAYPKSAKTTNAQIDADRFDFQDEYVEWRVERTAGKLKRITFTTEFLEYYEALAMVGVKELVAAIKAVIPGANPDIAGLFGPGFNPAAATPEARAARFRNFAQQSPWNNGQKGILCLAQGANTLGALFNLVGRAAIPNPAVPPGSVCATLGGYCGPDRNSDPSVATAVQTLARARRSLSLVDPAGIEIVRLGGIWRVKDKVIDINSSTTNQGIWTVTRKGRRGVLKVVPNLFLDDAAITTGTQVAAALRVSASVISAAEADLPEWARTGQESSQRLAEVAGGGVS